MLTNSISLHTKQLEWCLIKLDASPSRERRYIGYMGFIKVHWLLLHLCHSL